MRVYHGCGFSRPSRVKEKPPHPGSLTTCACVSTPSAYISNTCPQRDSFSVGGQARGVTGLPHRLTRRVCLAAEWRRGSTISLLRQPELAVSHRRLDQVRCVDDRTAHVPLRLESPWREVDSTWLSEDGSWSPAFRPPPSNGGKDADRRPVLRTCRRRVRANGIADLINSATDLSSPHMDVMARPESRPVTDKATRSEVSARACPLLHAKAGLPAKAPKLPPACIRTGWPTHSRPPVARAISYYTVARRIVSGYGRPA